MVLFERRRDTDQDVLGDRVDLAWKLVQDLYEEHPELIDDTDNAFFVALVLALVRRAETKARVRYGLLLFAVMTGGALAFGWFMFLFIKK